MKFTLFSTIFLLCFFGFSFSQDIEKTDSIVSKALIYPGCEEFTENIDLTKCFYSKFSQKFMQNFNADNLTESGRIIVSFFITKNGSIEIDTINNRSNANDAFILETKNTFTKINDLLEGKITPSKENGKPLKTSFKLPVNYFIE